MTTMLPWSPTLLLLPGYPGVDFDESEIVRDWLRHYGGGFDRFEFNRRLGVMDVATEMSGAAVDRMWALITRPRPDLLAYTSTSCLVIEAKVHARMRAVTQVQRYVRLLRRDCPGLTHVMPELICRSCDLGVERAMQQAGGALWLFPRPGHAPEVSA